MSSSILTSTNAMIAQQSLHSMNASLDEVRNRTSTGKRVVTAKDRAAVSAIFAVMESDVAGLRSIQDPLSLGASTIAVASHGPKQVREPLNEIKGEIVSANESNVDRSKLQMQQRLGAPALSIANQAPHSILALFR